jgi:hypothetical protein
MEKGLSTKHIIIVTIISIISLILIYSIIINPVIGKSDNGDFGRMYKLLGLSDIGTTYEQQFDSYFHMIYRVSNFQYLLPWCSNWVMGCWLGKIAFVLNRELNILNPGYFDIRYFGALYSMIFTIGVYFILRYNKFSNFARVVCGIFIILFFTDGIYISYFNSFFGEATTISCFFLMIGSFLYLISRKEPSKIHFIFFFISSACFLTSKTQQLPLLLFMWIIYFALYKFYLVHKKFILIVSIFVTVLCVLTFISIDDYTNKNNIYQSVFTGILYASENPQEDLKDLGLNPKFSLNSGTGFYDKDLEYEPLFEEMLEEFYPNISLGKVLKFYISDPVRAWEKVSVSADYTYSFYKIDQNNFIKGADYESKLVNSFRYNLFQAFPEAHRNIFVFIGFSIVYLIVIGFYFFKSKKKEVKLLTLMLLFLLAAGASQLVLPVLGSGFADFGKHLFLINLSYDILLGTVLVWVSNLLYNFVKKIRCDARIIQ